MLKLLSLIMLTSCLACTNPDTRHDQRVYLFSFFQDNGQDGLHLATSEDGFNWTPLNNNKSFLTPEVGEDKLMRDPCIIKGPDNKFHMVWTVSWNEKGIGYANSTDLINWSEQQYIPVMEHEPTARNCWAPELFYDDVAKQYVMYWATTIPGRFPETETFGDDKYNHRMYSTSTKDFIEFTETKLFYDKGFNVIDATIIKEDKEYVMFLKDETLLPEAQKNIRMASSKTLLGEYTDASQPITMNWVEGPTVTKNDNKWIVYFDKYRDHQMGAVMSYDLKNWTDVSDKINFPDGTRHGTVFKVKKRVVDHIRNSNPL